MLQVIFGVRVRFVTCDDPISFGIRFGTGGFLYSHAEVVMPDGKLLGAHADGGVEERPWGYDATYKPVEVIVDVPATPAQTDACHAYLRAQCGKPYDLGAIARIAQRDAWPTVESILRDEPPEWRDESKWFCSELVEAALEHAGIIPRAPDTVRKITPARLFDRLSMVAPVGLPTYAARPQAAAMQARPV